MMAPASTAKSRGEISAAGGCGGGGGQDEPEQDVDDVVEP